MRRLLSGLAVLVARRPRTVLLLGVFVPLLLALPAASVPVNFGFSSFINESLPLVGRYMNMNRRLGFSNRVLLLLEGPDKELEPAARALAQVLRERPDLVRQVQFEAPKDWLEDNAPWLVSNEIFEDWLLVATRSGDPQAAQRLEGHFEQLDDESARLVRPGVRLMTVELREDPLDEDLTAVSRGDSSYSQVQGLAESAVAGRSVQVSFGGVPAVSVQDQETTFKAITRLTPISLFVVLALLLFVERRLGRLLLVAVPMLLSVAAALGGVALLLHEITFGEAFFGMFIFGLGVDYALHLVVRLREERARGLPLEEAVHATVVGAGRGVAAGAITTVGAFLVIAMFPDPTARHLGISSGVGLLSCMLLMLTVLPAAWLLLGRSESEPEPRVLEIPGLARLCRFSVQHPRVVVGGALLLAVLSLSGSYRFHAETDLSKIFNRDVPAVAVGERIQELFEANISPWIVATSTIEEAREVHQAFAADPSFMRVEGIASLFPQDLEVRAQRLRAVASKLGAVRRQLEAIRIMMPAVAPPRVMKSLTVLERAAESGPPSLDELPEDIASMVRLPDGDFLTFAYGRFTGLDANTFREQRIRAEAIHPEATGWGAFVEVAVDPPWTYQIVAAVLLMVLLVLAIDQRSFRWMLLALLPVSFGASVTFGLMCWLDVGFTVMLTLVVPLLVGLGVDDGIHVVHRLREDETLPADVATCSVGRAIVMTTLTTCSSFTVMLFANHPGMESMALCLVLGLPLCLLASVTLIPAGAVLLGLRNAG